MGDRKTTFALLFGNRELFPASLIAQARKEVPRALREWGYEVLMIDEDLTPYGAVTTQSDGEVHAKFLRDNRSQYDGLIMCLPNFGDETGAVAAVREADVPILIQAYPDELDRMAPDMRRDAFCGKISLMNVFEQYGVKFSALKPHVVNPTSARFRANVDHFAGVCRVVQGMRKLVVGAIGARTTAFKTVRIDEVALQRHGITVETLDLSDVFARMRAVDSRAEAYKAKAVRLKKYASWDGTPQPAFDAIVRLGVVLDGIIDEYQMDAIAFRCWLELQEEFGISPCVLMGELNNRGICAACEVDVGSAIAMRALHLASGRPAICLDWNNNYGDEDDKCILFHCGSVAKSLMAVEGRIEDHAILASVVGPGRSYGCHVGRIAPMEFTFGGTVTDAGTLRFFLGQGMFTEDRIPDEFFGCAGVAQIEQLQDVILHVGYGGHRHHVSVTPGIVQAPVFEALQHYLDFEVSLPQ